jgi:RimJ/RimL family protein N-acetyltransferase
VTEVPGAATGDIGATDLATGGRMLPGSVTFAHHEPRDDPRRCCQKPNTSRITMTANMTLLTTGVTFHRLTPADAPAIRELHAALGARDGYYRFFGPCPKNLDYIARQIAMSDPQHCALGAFLENRLIGVANYVVLDDARCAEVAMVVGHEDQQLGIGTALLGRLAEEARRHRIERFVAEVLATNSRMMQLLMDIDLPISVRSDDGVVSVVLELGSPRGAWG